MHLVHLLRSLAMRMKVEVEWQPLVQGYLGANQYIPLAEFRKFVLLHDRKCAFFPGLLRSLRSLIHPLRIVQLLYREKLQLHILITLIAYQELHKLGIVLIFSIE